MVKRRHGIAYAQTCLHRRECNGGRWPALLEVLKANAMGVRILLKKMRGLSPAKTRNNTVNVPNICSKQRNNDGNQIAEQGYKDVDPL